MGTGEGARGSSAQQNISDMRLRQQQRAQPSIDAPWPHLHTIHCLPRCCSCGEERKALGLAVAEVHL